MTTLHARLRMAAKLRPPQAVNPKLGLPERRILGDVLLIKAVGALVILSYFVFVDRQTLQANKAFWQDATHPDLLTFAWVTLLLMALVMLCIWGYGRPLRGWQQAPSNTLTATQRSTLQLRTAAYPLMVAVFNWSGWLAAALFYARGGRTLLTPYGLLESNNGEVWLRSSVSLLLMTLVFGYTLLGLVEGAWRHPWRLVLMVLAQLGLWLLLPWLLFRGTMMPPGFATFWRTLIGIGIIGGLLTSTLLFLIVDQRWRPIFAQICPDDQQARRRLPRVSVGTRLMATSLFTGLLPLLIVGAAALSQAQNLPLIILFVVSAGIVSNLVLSSLTAHSLLQPLRDLAQAIAHRRHNRITGARVDRLPLTRLSNDELGDLTQYVSQQFVENRQLANENARMETELAVARQLQQMILPSLGELHAIASLDIASYMQPANEVGGDYFDVLQHNGAIKIGIGDVTGHGLQSGVMMLMVQTAVRTLLTSEERDPRRFLCTLNHTLFANVQRMQCNRSATLTLLDYEAGRLTISGQHESVIIARDHGALEVIDTQELGLPVALDDDIAHLVQQHSLQLQQGDVVALYTDGITEAANQAGAHYGLERLSQAVYRHRHASVERIKQAVIDEVRQFMGAQPLLDDMTLLVLKQK